jgi:hypothetical protein
VDQAVHKTLAGCYPKQRRAFAHLLWNVQSRSELLRPGRFVGRSGGSWPEPLVSGLLALVVHRRDWIRPVEEWEPGPGGPLTQFSSLAHHLLAHYPVPPVLLSAWFRDGGWARRFQHWFKHAGRGGSLLTAALPAGTTRRTAHEFCHAPAHFPIESAYRWAQVRALGGSEDLALAIASTRLGRRLCGGEFWPGVFQFLAHQRRLDLTQVEPVVEYLHDQRFVDRYVVTGEGTEVCVGPPQPDLSLKGRTLTSLLRRVAEWKARPTVRPERRVIRWQRSGIGEYQEGDEQGQLWTVRQLLDSDGLASEGNAMCHCVADYTSECARGLTTIWSLGLERPEGRQRLVTVEVCPKGKEVLQASMKRNVEPDEVCRTVLKRWADREGLKFE